MSFAPRLDDPFPQKLHNVDLKNKDCILLSEQECQFPSVCFSLTPVRKDGAILKLEWFIKA